MERDRKNDPSDETHSVGYFVGVPKTDGRSTAGATRPKRRLSPQPEKGMPFTEALDEAMRDHHAVFAALAK